MLERHSRKENAEERLSELRELSPAGDPVGRALEHLRLRRVAGSELEEASLRDLPPLAAPPAALDHSFEHLRSRAGAERQLSLLQARAPRRATARGLWRLRTRCERLHRRMWPHAAAIGVAAAAAAWLIAIAPQPSEQSGPETPVTSAQPALQPERAGQLVVGRAGDSLLERAGNVVAMRPGESLRRGDVIRTQKGRDLILRVGEDVELHVNANSELRLAGENAGVPLVDLVFGRVEGKKVGATRRAVRFLHRHGEVALLHGKLGVLRARSGRLSVAALDHSAVVTVGERRIELPAGHQLRLDAGKGIHPEPLPDRLAIRLNQERLLSGKRGKLVLSGKTDADVLLVINGQPVQVAATGRFYAAMMVEARRRRVTAVLTDAAGRTRELVHPIRRVGARWDWTEPE